jgi:hypothetical protein
MKRFFATVTLCLATTPLCAQTPQGSIERGKKLYQEIG